VAGEQSSNKTAVYYYHQQQQFQFFFLVGLHPAQLLDVAVVHAFGVKATQRGQRTEVPVLRASGQAHNSLLVQHQDLRLLLVAAARYVAY